MNGALHPKADVDKLWNICREYGMNGLAKEWYDHIPTPITTAGLYTVLYDQQI